MRAGVHESAERALSNEPMTANQVLLYHLGAAKRAGGRLLAAIGERHGRTARQVALNFLTRHPDVFTIPKTTRPARARKRRRRWKIAVPERPIADQRNLTLCAIGQQTTLDAAVAGWRLTPEEIASIDRAGFRYPFGRPVSFENRNNGGST